MPNKTEMHLVKEIKERLKFEELVTSLSTRFINMPVEEIDKQIELGLKSVIEVLGADRSSFFQFDADHSEMLITHSYAKEGFKPTPRMNVGKEFPWCISKLKSGKGFQIGSLRDLPEDAVLDRKNLNRIQVKSSLGVPISFGGRFTYVLTLGSLTTEKSWPEDLFLRLHVIGEVFANALARKRSHEKLIEHQEHIQEIRAIMQNIYEHSSSVIFVKDLEGRYLLVNRAFTERIDMEPDEVIGMTDSELFPKEVVESFRSVDRLVIESGRPMKTEESVPHEDGEHAYISAKFPLRKSNGEIFAVGGVATDINELKKSQSELEERLQFEKLIAELSTTFVNMPIGKIDKEINLSLMLIAKHLGLDRIALLQFDEGPSSELRLTHTYAERKQHRAPIFLVSDRLAWYTERICHGEAIVISKINDLPKDAMQEREYMKEQGFKSFLTIPLKVEEAIIGAVSYSDMKYERIWSDELIKQLWTVSEMVANTLVRKRSEEVLLERFQFQSLIADLSAKFVNLNTAEVDQQIKTGLKRIVEYLNIDRCSLVHLDKDHQDIATLYTYAANGIKPRPDIPEKASWPWFYLQWRKGQAIQFSATDELPAAASNELKRTDLISGAAVPISVGGKYDYVLTIGAVKAKRSWPDDLVQRLRLFGEIFVNALERQKADLKISSMLERLEQEKDYLQVKLKIARKDERFIGKSTAIRNLLGLARQVAKSDSSVLLMGETGVGKEVLANFIHSLSSRKDKPMIMVNCAALPATLIESELFGREKGAYTGALAKQIGRFELAHGSTIFLDEISELPLELQVKLLRVIEERQFERLGSSKTITVDVRFIATTNRDLNKMVKEGSFREDLYYRLNVFPLLVAPLRERREDIPLLTWTFVKEFEKNMGKRINSIPKSTMDTMLAYSWPGNVRELKNVIERAMILTTSSVLMIGLPSSHALPKTQDETLAETEKYHILDVLERTHWRVRGTKGAAEILGLKPSTLESRMKKLQIKRPK